MSAGLDGRVALVTGGGQGIGEGIVRALFEDGAKVAVLDVNPAPAERLVLELDPDGVRAMAVVADVSDEAAFREAVDGVERRLGGVDVLVNNAALNIGRPFDQVDTEEWDAVLAVNLRGVQNGCRIAGERMRHRGFGRIVNLASDAGQQPNEFVGAHYAASKGGVIALTKAVARTLAPHGVTVNAVAPAAVEGPVMDSMPAAQLDRLRAGIPVGRFGRPDEVGALVAFLAGDNAGYITGATIDINGGVIMR